MVCGKVIVNIPELPQPPREMPAKLVSSVKQKTVHLCLFSQMQQLLDCYSLANPSARSSLCQDKRGESNPAAFGYPWEVHKLELPNSIAILI